MSKFNQKWRKTTFGARYPTNIVFVPSAYNTHLNAKTIIINKLTPYLHLCSVKSSVVKNLLLDMCYILCMIVGLPIRGFEDGAAEKKNWGLIQQFFGRSFAFGGLVAHGISTHDFLIPVKELRL
jgi:hypothetical protein